MRHTKGGGIQFWELLPFRLLIEVNSALEKQQDFWHPRQHAEVAFSTDGTQFTTNCEHTGENLFVWQIAWYDQLPIVSPVRTINLFRNRVFTMSALLSLLQLMVLVGIIIYLPFFLQGVADEAPANTGFLLIAFTLASVIGTMATGFIVGSMKRHKPICIVGALLMTVGVFLLTRMDANINFFLVISAMIIAGLGVGVFFLVPSLATQNSLPPTRLGVGTAAIRYMGQLGAVLGLAITGTVVNNTLSAQLAPQLAHIPEVRMLPAPILKLATNPQVLVNSNEQAALVNRLLQQTPPEARPTALHTLNLVFDTLKSTLQVALFQAFIVVLITCIASLLCAFLIKDTMMQQSQKESEVAAVE